MKPFGTYISVGTPLGKVKVFLPYHKIIVNKLCHLKDQLLSYWIHHKIFFVEQNAMYSFGFCLLSKEKDLRYFVSYDSSELQ